MEHMRLDHVSVLDCGNDQRQGLISIILEGTNKPTCGVHVLKRRNETGGYFSTRLCGQARSQAYIDTKMQAC